MKQLSHECGRNKGCAPALLAAVAAALVLLAAQPLPAPAADLTRFLPNNGNSVYPATGLLRRWPPQGPKLLWRADVGWGKSAVVEAAGLAFTATETDDKQYAICLDAETGAVRWKRLLLPKGNRHFARGPVTSPVIDQNRIYFVAYAIDKDVWDMRCPVVCLTLDGKQLWRMDQKYWATEAATPLVAGETLYVAADNPQRVVLVALDKRTGQLRWSFAVEPSERKRELAAPASLTFQTVDGVPQVIVATYGTREVLGVHAETGRLLWRYPYPEPLVVGMISTPVAVGRRVFISGAEGRGLNFSACLEMHAHGTAISYKELYVSRTLQTNNYNTVAIYDNAVFGFGGSRTAGFLHCTNLDDGRLLWRHDSRDWSKDQNLVIADGLIFAVARNNQVVLAEASRQGYQELGRLRVPADLGRPQQPTIVNGRMYLRALKAVLCYQVAGGE